MDCHEIQELLVELAYDELEGPQRQAVLDHLGQCAECSREFRRLTHARSALQAWRANEPPMIKAAGALPAAGADQSIRRQRRTVLSWLVPAVAAAAVIVIAVFVVRHVPEVQILPPVYGQEPVKIERVNVAVTIMSQPPEWARLFGEADFQTPNVSEPNVSARQEFLPQSDDYGGQQQELAPYRQPTAWPGMALIRDQRMIVNMKKGANAVQFTDVPQGILPDSVRLRSMDAPKGLTIVEQNYQYDLASAWAILKKYVDKDLTVQFKDGSSTTGKLLSYDNAQLVIQPVVSMDHELRPPEGPRNVARQEIRAIAFEKLPDGLLTRPTLLWQLDNQAQPQQQLEVAYLTTGLKWRADYVLKLRPAGAVTRPESDMLPQEATTRKHGTQEATQPGKAVPRWKESPIPNVIDSAEIVGYATVANNSGVGYKNAQLKLMAGDLHLIMPERPRDEYYYEKRTDDKAQKPGAGFAEKSFFEYHLYTLGRLTDLADREVKQLELVTGDGLKLTRNYVYDPNVNPTAVRVVSEIENSKANGLGVPLPKGVIRLYAPDPDGVDTYVAQTQIDHTPVDEILRLPWGFAFDVVCHMSQTDRLINGDSRENKFNYQIRNHKDHDINVTVVASVPITSRRVECKLPWHVREVGTIEIYVPVKANSETNFDLSVEYGITSGGGLVSPYDTQTSTERK